MELNTTVTETDIRLILIVAAIGLLVILYRQCQ